MKIICKKFFEGSIIITDPMYIVKQEKLEDDSTKPSMQSFYPQGWTPPSEEDYFNNTEKALIAKRCEQNYKDAVQRWKDSLPNDWDVCNYGENMNYLGFKKFLVTDTIYGSWSCTTYGMNEQVIGRFTSDSGLVGVFLLEEILKYHSQWDLHLTKPYCASLIPDFVGNISIVNRGGDSPGDCDIRIIGNGNIIFSTKQTGF